MRKQLQRKAEAPASAPTTQTQLSTGDVINVPKQDKQGTKCTLATCRIDDIEETPTARFRDLQYLLWVFNADLFVEYDSARFVPKWLFGVMMLGKDLIFYGDTDVVHRIGRDMQRLWRIEGQGNQLQCISIMPSCRYTVGCRGSSQPTCISVTSRLFGLEQKADQISRYFCGFRCF